MDKVREEFEAWFMKEKADKIQDDIQFLTKEIMYEGWKASRESVTVQVPEKQDQNACLFDFQRAYVQGYNHGIDACAKQLIEEGIKYE